MKRINAAKILLAYTLILSFAVTGVVAQEQPVEPNEQMTSGLSGKVVDTEGKPLAGFTFMILSLQNVKGDVHPVIMPPHLLHEQLAQHVGKHQPGMPRSMAKVETDAEGAFSATNILPGHVQIIAVPKKMLDAMEKIDPNKPQQAMHIPMEFMMGGEESEMPIISIRLNKITFYYPDRWGPIESFMFGLKPDVHLEDVKITVKQRLKIRAQIVYADGTSVANVRARLSMRYTGGEFGGGSGTHGTSCFTDAEGNFTQYRDDPGYYTLSITYGGFTGGAGPFLLKKDVHPEKIVIKLDGNPVDAKRPSGKIKELDEETVRRLVKNLPGNEGVRKPIIRPPAKPAKIVWIINPENGHAYAKIQCQDWHDAQRKAIKEGAHLVSINNEDEQFWLDVIFSNIPFWIGLNDVDKEGEWRWDSGEPVTYTNWTTHDIFPDDAPDSEKDFVAVSLHESGWQSVSPKGHLWRMARHAVIEKDGLVSKIPEAAESEDE